MAKLTKEDARDYLIRKGKEPTDKNINEIMKKGKIYGDPIVEIEE